jgi:hypothetical protein
MPLEMDYENAAAKKNAGNTYSVPGVLFELYGVV